MITEEEAAALQEVVGKTLRYYRKSKELTQCELAKQLGLNHTSHICTIEYGKSAISLTYLEKFLKILGVSLEDFFRHTDVEMTRWRLRQNPTELSKASVSESTLQMTSQQH